MKVRRALTAALGFVLSVAIGCGGSAPEAFFGGDAKMSEAGPPMASAAPAPDAPGGGNYGGLEDAFRRPDQQALASNGTPQATPTATAQGQNEPPRQQGPMIVYTANLHLSVIQVAETSKEIEAMARETGGFLQRRDDSEIVIRVPVAKFDETMKRLEKLGEVLHRNVVAEDVSDQYLDAEVRLKNARAVRDRLKQLLEKATKVEDSLAIEKELARIGTEIEVLEGKLKYLRDRAQFSTITVRLTAKQSDDVKAKAVRIPVDWLDHLGLGRLLDL